MKNKKYKTLRAVVDFFADNDIIDHEWLSGFFTEIGIQFLLREECIEEIKELEFTKDDMILFGKYCDAGNQENYDVYENALNKWTIKRDENNNPKQKNTL